MGIHLHDLSNLPHDSGMPIGPFASIITGDLSNNELLPVNLGSNAMYGNGGHDALLAVQSLNFDTYQDLLDGGAGNDTLVGAGGNDYLIGGQGDDFGYVSNGDLFFGGDGDDITVGETSYTNSLATGMGEGSGYAEGGVGNDTLIGALGQDVLFGGEDNDILRGENRPDGWLLSAKDVDGVWKNFAQPSLTSLSGAADYLDGGAGDDLLVGDGGDDVLVGGSGNDTLYGESDFALTVPGNDWLDGGEGNDRLAGGAGADLLSGGDGDDLLIGDFLNDPGSTDILDGGAGADELQGGGGDDILYGGTGMDRLAGFDGEDFLDGGADDDELQGGAGDDSLWGDSGNDRLVGQEGDDSLFGDEGDDLMVGGIGSDTLFGGEGQDGLFGNEGEDFLAGEAGDDLLNGGLGNDQLDGGDGIDDVQGREGNDQLVGGAGGDLLYGDGNDPTALNVIGGDDTLDGQDGDDQLWGGGGQDQLFGGDGADHLVGEVGNDQLYGEGGNDVLVGDSSFFPREAGTDLLDGGDGDDTLQGGGGNDELEGGSGDDVLLGEFWDVSGATAGDDDLHGGAGNDRLIGGAGSDSYRFNLGDGVDSIEDVGGQNNRLVFGAGITVDSLRLDVAAGDSLVLRVGNNGDAVQMVAFGISAPGEFHSIGQFEFADGTVLTDSQLLARGFHISAPVNGGTVLGTAFVDHIKGSQADDWLYGRDGNDVMIGGQGDDVLEGEEGDDELDGGAGNDRLYGSAGSNVLRGGEGNDILESTGAADQLFGGAGDDSYHLWSALQTIEEDVNAGTDTIHLAPTASLLFQTPDHIENVQIQDDLYLDPTMRVDLVGNTLNNQLSGSHRLDGREGDDTLVGIGDNTFVFGRGYGHDTVRMGTQWHAHTGLDQVEFLSDIAPADFILENHADDLVVKINGTTDQLTLESYFISSSNRVDQFVFADGTIWGLNDVESRVLTFVGSEADDIFYGTFGNDTIRGLGGNDQIRTSLGNDTLDGGTGNDFLEGYVGNDIYVFGRGYGQDAIDEQGDAEDVDTLQLTEGINPDDITLRATPDFGSDAILTINNTTDELTLVGFFSFDSFRVDRIQFADGTIWDYSAMLAHTEGVNMEGSEDSDYLYGNITNDILSGLGGDDSLNGGAGHDTLLGGSGADELNGANGNDILDGGVDGDVMIGGSGNDVYVIDNVGDVVTEQSAQGADTVQSSISYMLGTNVEYLTLTGSAAVSGTGNSLNNTLSGNGAANVLSGGAGNDTYVAGLGDTIVEAASAGIDTVKTDISWILGTNVENLVLTGTAAVNGTGNSAGNNLTGNSAANILDGGTGVDTLIGGQGDDTYIVDNASDMVAEVANEGVDAVESSVTYTLAANVENMMLTGTSAINGTGNTLNNVIIGNSGANVLNGGAGIDSMTGGAGNDIYVVDNAAEAVRELVNAGIDTVQSSVTYALGNDVEYLTLTGNMAINGTGNALNNRITGNTGSNTIDGGGGVDSMSGGDGNDTYIVDNPSDTVSESSNGGSDTVQSSITFTLGANIEILTLTGSGVINGTGNNLANVLTGNSAANVLTGGTGADTMAGGAGDDTYAVDNTGDTVTENADEGLDLVRSSVTFTLGANVEHLMLSGTGLINGTGNGLDNTLTGNSAANVLTGGVGNDIYVVGTGDTVIEQPGGGMDTVKSSITWTLGTNLENLTLIGTSAINGTGNTGSNTLVGNSAVNTLTGGAGNDTLDGGAAADNLRGGSGDDTYVRDNIGDLVTENANEGTDTVQSSVTYTLGTNVENLTLVGTSAINGTGNASNNTLMGNNANNVLTGLAGNDTYHYNRGGGQDTIIDHSGASDIMLFGSTINPLDLILSRQANDLRMAVYGSTDHVTIQGWYSGATTQMEMIQTGNGEQLMNTQVNQLIQTMAGFTQQTGLSWEQAIAQRPQDIQQILAENWQ
ncbi:MAG: protein of unknown function, putative Hemolysin-type calcium-binding protein [Nitrospira sp.]|nr:protein of unknown function, putative Hemolysin-type calcium-binding protein [Nitrospira sp.]